LKLRDHDNFQGEWAFKPSREWPVELPDAPKELIELIQDALVDFGPDRHCDGAEEIAALAINWVMHWLAK
jgi:hypothetical protein